MCAVTYRGVYVKWGCFLKASNVRDFRGHELDSGAVFEIDYAIGHGKAMWCYNVPTISLIEQIACDQSHKDRDGYTVENFGWPRNL